MHDRELGRDIDGSERTVRGELERRAWAKGLGGRPAPISDHAKLDGSATV